MESALDKLMRDKISFDFTQECKVQGSNTFVENHDDEIKPLSMIQKNTLVSATTRSLKSIIDFEKAFIKSELLSKVIFN